ncbi:hypothetical protein A2870_01750 [Candidatus Curtissbacteria bacterium RIFCSPHIGHO2_01_FULL_41_11]|uniref:Glycosyltransferase 2-like domain-containing protein n=1 Tax=Candidatus Curtissbacteria bacterium RIFCSPHIGHO2_01_FULL_41_11 TaxID=1797711 RepID=A0A1F5G594_9BACT|nr:MAG: hypothetical protein A2870_01750 [Candidatus Curtissbacteria bacterium RIFCSPHIGHO2_01_FULL_41_11]
MKNKKLISIVTPCYNEEENITLHFKTILKITKPFRTKYNFEFVYTDNCSEDKTFSLLKDLAKNYKNLKAVRFSRNIGVNRSIYFGLSQARGDAAILIQADLQDPPELIPQFIKWWENGFDVVYGKVTLRKEFLIMRYLRQIYYKLITTLSEIDIPQNAGEFRIMSRRVLDAIGKYKEDDIYLRGVIAHIGYKQRAIPYVRGKRMRGKSNANFFHLITYAINGLLSTTVVPIRLTLIIGLLFSTTGFLLTIIIVITKFAFPNKAPQGFTMLATIVTFFAGVQMFSIGIIGEYIRKIYIQSLNRPQGFIEEKINL